MLKQVQHDIKTQLSIVSNKHMKKLFFLSVLIIHSSVLIFNTASAQAPSGFTYQSVLRDANNDLIINTAVGTQISILQTTAGGTAVYVETHTETTNANGLLTLQVGAGSVQSGTFASIDWSLGPYFVKTETDPAGGATYTITGTQQMMSVPYALYAETSGTGGATGPSGADGSNGSDGATGANGTNGNDGATGPTGVTGATGPAGSPAVYADFYAMIPSDIPSAVGVGQAVPFPQDGVNSGTITRASPAEFIIPDVGVYQVQFILSVTEPGQLALRLNGFELPYTTVGRATGENQISGTFIIETILTNSSVEVVNTGFYTLTITPYAGGPSPVSAHLVITKMTDGVNGATGTTGADGASGSDGATGPQGPTGNDGADGQGGLTQAGTGITVTGAGGVGDPYIVSTTGCSYSIGQHVPALGGYIFYLDGSGCHGLVAKTQDEPSGYLWSSNNFDTWAFASGIFGGAQNTKKSIARAVANGSTCPAATQASLTDGFNDWYLPSKDELDMMYVNLHLQGLGGFANGGYWSSTEFNSIFAWAQSFSSGNQFDANKDAYGGYVRSVRAF
jgi:hypothetical protein